MMNRTDVQTEGSALKEDYPSVECLYPIALNAYEWAQKRRDSADNRLQALLVFFSAVILIIPTLVDKRLPNAQFRSWWFVVAISFFVLAAICGIIGRFSGDIERLNIEKLYNSSLHLPEWEFKKNMIYRAMLDFKTNDTRLESKRKLAQAMISLFLASVLCFVIWIYKFTT